MAVTYMMPSSMEYCFNRLDFSKKCHIFVTFKSERLHMKIDIRIQMAVIGFICASCAYQPPRQPISDAAIELLVSSDEIQKAKRSVGISANMANEEKACGYVLHESMARYNEDSTIIGREIRYCANKVRELREEEVRQEAQRLADRKAQQIANEEAERKAEIDAYPAKLSLAVNAMLDDSGRVDVRSHCVKVGLRADLADKCEKEGNTLFRSAIASGKHQPISCYQWAIAQGTEWEASEFDMKSNVIGGSDKPVRFYGNIKNYEDQQMLVFSGQDNAIIDFSENPKVFNGDMIKVGTYVSGYGIKSGNYRVNLVNGQETVIPAIKASCLIGYGGYGTLGIGMMFLVN